jgi:hypothetical protein
MTVLTRLERSEKLFGFGAGRETAEFFIVRIVLRCIGRTHDDKVPAISLNKFGHVFAVAGRHMPRATMRAVVVAHAGPFVGPYPLAAGASVDVEKPGHGGLQRFSRFRSLPR